MELHGVGKIIYYMREKKGLTQMQVCKGICTKTTISRIEKGGREYDSLISETLLGRLGGTASRLEFVLDDQDYCLYEMRERLLDRIKNDQAQEAKALMKRYKAQMPPDNRLHQQFLLYCEALYKKNQNASREEVCSLLHQAIALTRPDYLDRTNGMLLYSPIEVHLIYHLFLYENYTEEELYPVIRFMEELYDAKTQIHSLIPFLYEWMKRYEAEEDWQGLKAVCERAVRIINKGRGYDYLADFCFGKVEAEEGLLRSESLSEEKRGQLLKECRNCFYMSMIEEDTGRMEKIQKFCEEKLGCQIIRQAI